MGVVGVDWSGWECFGLGRIRREWLGKAGSGWEKTGVDGTRWDWGERVGVGGSG